MATDRPLEEQDLGLLRELVHPAAVTYNAGLHKARNMATYLIGYGGVLMLAAATLPHERSAWVALIWAEQIPVWGSGLIYTLAGVVSSLALRTRLRDLGLAVQSVALITIALASFAHLVRSHPEVGDLLALYVHGSLAVIGVSAVRDYFAGYPPPTWRGPDE